MSLDDCVELGIGAVFVLLVAAIIGFAVWSGKEWDRYAAAHNCQPTGQTSTDLTMIPQTAGRGSGGKPGSAPCTLRSGNWPN